MTFPTDNGKRFGEYPVVDAIAAEDVILAKTETGTKGVTMRQVQEFSLTPFNENEWRYLRGNPNLLDNAYFVGAELYVPAGTYHYDSQAANPVVFDVDTIITPMAYVGDWVHFILDGVVRAVLSSDVRQKPNSFPVNQRGKAVYTEPGYGIDRWTSDAGYYLVSDGLIISSQSTIIQKSDENKLKSLLGKQVTFSILFADNTLINSTGTFPDETPTLQTNVVTVSAPNGILAGVELFANNQGVYSIEFARITNTGASDVKIQAIKLELGDTQTLAHQDADGNWVLNEIPKYGEVLAECQRYLYPIFPIGRDNADSGLYTNYVFPKDKVIAFRISLPVAMRVLPILLDYEEGRLIRFNPSSGSTAYTVNSVGISDFLGDELVINFAVAEEVLNGYTYHWDFYTKSYADSFAVLSSQL